MLYFKGKPTAVKPRAANKKAQFFFVAMNFFILKTFYFMEKPDAANKKSLKVQKKVFFIQVKIQEKRNM